MRRRGAASAIVVLVTMGCARDLVLPDDVGTRCGDGMVSGDEECDVAHAGCRECRLLPGYTCDGVTCEAHCVEGTTGEGVACANPRKLEACDMTGYWAGRETTYARDAVISELQTASSYYLYRFVQEGEAFHVEEMIHCGVEVTGSANVAYTAGTLRGLLYENRQDPPGAHGPRRGTFRATEGGCAFSFDRFYNVRGVDASFLPATFVGGPELSTLPALPARADPLSPPTPVPGATDPDRDGLPGAAYRIGGIVSGVRNGAQREHKEYATRAGAPLVANAVELVVPGIVDVQESTLSITECAAGNACSLLASAAVPARDQNNRVTLRFIGLTREGAKSVVAGPLREDPETDLASCEAVRRVLPHDPSEN